MAWNKHMPTSWLLKIESERIIRTKDTYVEKSERRISELASISLLLLRIWVGAMHEVDTLW